jgi:hypothetical protein
MCRRSFKAIVLIKLPGFIVQGMDKQGAYTCILGYLYATLHSVAQQGRT